MRNATSLVMDSAQDWWDEHGGFLLRALVVAGVLAAALYLPSRISVQRVAMLAAAGVAAGFLRWPQVGPPALVLASLLVPFSIGTGTGTQLNVTILLLAGLLGLWGLDILIRRELQLVPCLPLVPLVLLLVAAFLAFMGGRQPQMLFAQTAPLRAQAGGLALFLLSAGAFLLAAHRLQDGVWLQRVTWVFLTVGGVLVVGRAVPQLGSLTEQLFQKGADGSVFWTWLVALGFSQAVFNRSITWPVRLALLGMVLATFYLNLYAGRSWISGWLPPLVALSAVLWARSPRLGLAATVLAGVPTVLNAPALTGLVMTGDNEFSLQTRLEAWRILAGVVEVNPMLGLGPANYYWYTPLFSLFGYHVRFNSHNNYVDIVAQTGVLGLACFLWFMWEMGLLGWRLRTRASAGFELAYVYGALGGLAGTLAAGMLGDWVVPFVYNVGFQGFRASVLGWLFLGGLLAVQHALSRQPATSGEQRNAGE